VSRLGRVRRMYVQSSTRSVSAALERLGKSRSRRIPEVADTGTSVPELLILSRPRAFQPIRQTESVMPVPPDRLGPRAHVSSAGKVTRQPEPMPYSLFALYPFNHLDCNRGSRSPIRSAHPAEVRAAGSGVVMLSCNRQTRGLLGRRRFVSRGSRAGPGSAPGGAAWSSSWTQSAGCVPG
jgi:hypothetical protein